MHLRILLPILFFILSVNAKGQEFKVVRDVGLWTEISISKDFLKDFMVSTNQQLRFHEDCTKLDDWISELGLEYKINKNFAIAANGRYTKNYKYNEPSQNDYRYNFDLNYDAKITPVSKLFYRLRYQKEFYGNSVFNEYLNYYESAFRHRIKFRYEKSEKWRYYTTAELFRLTKRARDPYFRKLRWWIGSDYPIKPGVFDMAFGLEHQLNAENPYTYYLFRIKYKLNL